MRPRGLESLERAELKAWFPPHPLQDELLQFLSGPLFKNSMGYPITSRETFHFFKARIPHLFSDGLQLLLWIEACERQMEHLPSGGEEHLRSQLELLRGLVHHAAICSLTDLWLLRQILGFHAELGILERFLQGNPLDPVNLAGERGISEKHLMLDFRFLYNRGLLNKSEGGFALNTSPATIDLFNRMRPLPRQFLGDKSCILVKLIQDPQPASSVGEEACAFLQTPPRAPFLTKDRSWHPQVHDLELGFRILPLVLALWSTRKTPLLKRGTDLDSVLPHTPTCLIDLLQQAGYVTAEGQVSPLGERVFDRGPGPLGIIHAYHPYMSRYMDLLDKRAPALAVSRAANISAAQDANRKSFAASNDNLDRFCEKYSYRYQVFIEHALGQGEATRQRYLRDQGGHLIYLGADLEKVAIEQAKKRQAAGELPPGMIFVPSADIGQPQILLQALRDNMGSLDQLAAVMVVGNGFHEVRNQTDESMVAVFRAYQEAGLLLIFIEETGLSDEQIRMAAWNTYHAGFRFVHELSGQGLRPFQESDCGLQGRASWCQCLKMAGYVLLPELTTTTRSILPCAEGPENPPISVNYFCLPHSKACELGISSTSL